MGLSLIHVIELDNSVDYVFFFRHELNQVLNLVNECVLVVVYDSLSTASFVAHPASRVVSAELLVYRFEKGCGSLFAVR